MSDRLSLPDVDAALATHDAARAAHADAARDVLDAAVRQLAGTHDVAELQIHLHGGYDGIVTLEAVFADRSARGLYELDEELNRTLYAPAEYHVYYGHGVGPSDPVVVRP